MEFVRTLLPKAFQNHGKLKDGEKNFGLRNGRKATIR